MLTARTSRGGGLRSKCVSIYIHVRSVCIIIDGYKTDVSRSAEQTPRDRWSLAVLKPFRKKYIDGGDARGIIFFCFFFPGFVP